MFSRAIRTVLFRTKPIGIVGRAFSSKVGVRALSVSAPTPSNAIFWPLVFSLALGISSLTITEADSRVPFSNFVADVVGDVSPAVVNIRCMVKGPFGVRAVGAGSGFIISKDGFIVTNAHVVEHSVDGKITVCMKNGHKRIGQIHSIDSISDIALVKLVESDPDLPVIALGSSGKTRAGEFVVAIGSPSNLSDSVSFGIVSAVARSASELGMTNNRSNYIQTDAAINRGNSGGPLVNMNGEVIGINNMTLSGTEGVSFAIPMDMASQVIKQLMERKKVIRPYMGLRMANVTKSESFPGGRSGAGFNKEVFELLNAGEGFVQIQDVVSGSPADRAGLKK